MMTCLHIVLDLRAWMKLVGECMCRCHRVIFIDTRGTCTVGVKFLTTRRSHPQPDHEIAIYGLPSSC